MARTNGKLGFISGTSRQGKTETTKHMMRKTNIKRGIVWSPKENIDLYQQTKIGAKVYIVKTKADLINTVINTVGEGNGLIIFDVSNLDDFDYFCKVAFAWGKIKPCMVVGEEMADVSTPAKAPEGWGQLCRKGLGYGIHIFSITQRPSESEKTSLGNASYIICHLMVRDQDRKYMAKELNVSPDNIRDLKEYHHIFYDFKQHKVQKIPLAS